MVIVGKFYDIPKSRLKMPKFARNDARNKGWLGENSLLSPMSVGFGILVFDVVPCWFGSLDAKLWGNPTAIGRVSNCFSNSRPPK